MKLQIIEISYCDLQDGCWHYRYLLELDERLVATTENTIKEMNKDEAYETMIRFLFDKSFDTNLEHYNRFNQLSGLSWKVIFEQEVSDHYLKDLIIQKRINELEKDFV